MIERTGLDWSNLPFGYHRTPLRFQAHWRDGQWDDGALVEDSTVSIEEGACSINYGQSCFEGLKCFCSADDVPLLFRPHQNSERLARSARRLLMPEVPKALFLHALEETVRANLAWLPPYGTGATMYLRPLLLGVGDNLGLRPASSYIFRVFCSPVGPYFKGGVAGIRLATTEHDRAAPKGTGAYKVAGNYAGGLLASKEAQDAGFSEALYLDAAHHRYLEEAGSANIFAILADGSFVTPLSESILPSITLDAVMILAQEELGLRVERRPMAIDEVEDFKEMGCTGTAAGLVPVLEVSHHGKTLASWSEPGETCRSLYRALIDVQNGTREDSRGWVSSVEVP